MPTRHVPAVRSTRFLPSPVAFYRAARDALEAYSTDVTLTLGAQCPPGDVFWVQSVHRAYLDRSRGPTMSGWEAPAWFRISCRGIGSSLPWSAGTSTAHARVQSCAPRLKKYRIWVRTTVSPLTGAGSCPTASTPLSSTLSDAGAQRDVSRARLGMSSDEMSILFVANELHRKGFGTLIEAVAEAECAGGACGRGGAGLARGL